MRHVLRLLVAATIALVAILAFVRIRGGGGGGGGPAGEALPVLGSVPELRLVERSGRPIGRGDLAGKVWIVDFIFTRCTGPCPAMTEHMGRLERELADASDARFLSISLDPDHDTPEVLRRHAESVGARGGRWLFATGPADHVRRVAIEGFKLGTGVEDGTIVHSTRFVLVDRGGRIRAYFSGEDPAATPAIVAAARALLREAAAP